MPYIIAFFIFVAVGLLAWVGFATAFSEERSVSKRLEGLAAYEASQAEAAHPQLQPFWQRMVVPGWERLRGTLARMAPKDVKESLRHQVVLAGGLGGIDVERVLALKVLSTICAACLVVAVAVLLKAPASAWLLGAAACIASFWLPDVWLSWSISRRQHEIRTALPDMLDMLTISVEAGLGFDQAIAKIVRMSHGALAEEFTRMLQEIQAGATRTDALKRMTARTEVEELNTFATAIVQAERLGIPVANVLRVQAKEMRLMRRQRAEEQAQKTPVKIVFPLVLCILPATLIVILGPAIISIVRALF